VAKAGSIDIWLNAYTGPFEKGLAKAQKSLASFASGFADINGAVEVAQKAWGTFSMVAEKFADQLAKLDELADMGQRLGVSADSLQVFQRAIQLAGGDIDGLDKSLVVLRRNLGDAAMGQGGAVKAFERLGINAKELAESGVDEAFKRAVVELSKIENPTIRAAEASDIFGKSAANLAGLLDDQGHAMRQATREMKSYGIEMDKNAQVIEAAVQAQERMELAKKKAEASAAIATAPYWEKYYQGKDWIYSGVSETEWTPMEFIKGLGVPGMVWRGMQRAEQKFQKNRFTNTGPTDPFEITEDSIQRAMRSQANSEFFQRFGYLPLPQEMMSDSLDAYMQRTRLRPAAGPASQTSAFGAGGVAGWRLLESLGIEASGPRGIGMGGGAAALEFGTASAFSAIQQSQREDEMRKLQRQEVDESKKQTKVLEEMRGFFKNTVQLVEAGLQG